MLNTNTVEDVLRATQREREAMVEHLELGDPLRDIRLQRHDLLRQLAQETDLARRAKINARLPFLDVAEWEELDK